MELKPGSRLRSAVCDVEVVVVKAPAAPATIGCGGHPMVPAGDAQPDGAAIDPALATGTLIGKRYADEGTGVELLVTKGGDGTLTVDGSALPLKDAKPLPSSD